MDHVSPIALGIAVQKLDKRLLVINGDETAIMHLGAMALIGVHTTENLVHIVINNTAHESVGGKSRFGADSFGMRVFPSCKCRRR